MNKVIPAFVFAIILMIVAILIAHTYTDKLNALIYLITLNIFLTAYYGILGRVD